MSEISRLSRSTVKVLLSADKPASEKSAEQLINQINYFLQSTGKSYRHLRFEEEYTPHDLIADRIDYERLTPARNSIENALIENLSAIEFAALSLTNANTWDNRDPDESFRLLTSKEAYYFVPLIQSYSSGAIGESELIDHIDQAFDTVDTSPVPQIFELSDASTKSHLLDGVDMELFRKTNQALTSLYDRKLIIDPITETIGVASIAILGLVPVSFTKRTDDGDVIYRKISAMLWEYERLTEEEKTSVEFHFRVEKSIELIRTSVKKLNDLVNANQNDEQT